MHSNVIVTRELIDTQYAQTVRDDINKKNLRLEVLKHELKELKDGLALVRVAEEYNELEKDILELRRSLYIHGYKDDQSMNITNYILRVPNNQLEVTSIAQIISIKTNKEFIRFSPLKQYFWCPEQIDISKILKTNMEVNGSSYEDITQDDDNFTISDTIIEMFERGFGEVNIMFVLKQSEIFGQQIFKANIVKGHMNNIERIHSYKIIPELTNNLLNTRFI